jgi:hypothetical protein
MASVSYGIYAWVDDGWRYSAMTIFLFTFVFPILLGGGVFFVLASKKK